MRVKEREWPGVEGVGVMLAVEAASACEETGQRGKSTWQVLTGSPFRFPEKHK